MFTIDPLTSIILLIYGIAIVMLFNKSRNTWAFAARNQYEINGLSSDLDLSETQLNNLGASFNDLINDMDAIDTELGDVSETLTRVTNNINEHLQQMDAQFDKLAAKQRATQSDVEQIITAQIAVLSVTKDKGTKAKATPKPVKKSKPTAKKPQTNRKTTR